MLRRLNLGCGSQKKGDFINIDNDPQWTPDMLRDITKGLPFDTASVDEIYSENALEHITPDDVIFVLQEMQRVLKYQGKATLVVPLHVVPDISHKCFYHAYSFDNLLQQGYRYHLDKIKIVGKEFKRFEPPFDYEQITVTFEKTEKEQNEP